MPTGDVAATVGRPQPVSPPERTGAWERLDWILLGAVTLLGAFLRFPHLAFPNRLVFDEVYYARDACLYLHHSAAGLKFCGIPNLNEQSYVHPPLGKWIISAGEAIWGYNSYGWRIMPALFGTGLVALVFLLGRRLFGRWGGAIGGFLAAIDFVLITQSRLAMLDIFLAFFVVLGFLATAREHERVVRLRAAAATGEGRLDLGWRIAMGLAFGAACSVKWSGAYALAGAGVLALAWNVGPALRRARRTAGAAVGREPGAGSPGPLAETVATLAAVGLPAIALYLAAYAQWFTQNHGSLRAFVSHQHSMLSFQLHLTKPHPYQTRAWTWPFQIHPIAYWHEAGHALAHQILLFPNPLVWWAAIPAGIWVLTRAIRRRLSPERIVMTGWLAQYLPWLIVTRPLFFFYMTPVTPFMDLALAAALVDLGSGSAFRRKVVVAYLLGAALVLAYYYPGLVGALHARLL